MNKVMISIMPAISYVGTIFLLHTPITWIFWTGLGFAAIMGASLTFSHDIVQGIAPLIVEVRFTRHIRPLLEQQEEPIYSDDFHHMAEALRTMATAGRISIASQHQEIEPYIPPEPLPRYEIVMHDDWQSGDTSDMPLQVNEKAITSFSSDKTA